MHSHCSCFSLLFSFVLGKLAGILSLRRGEAFIALGSPRIGILLTSFPKEEHHYYTVQIAAYHIFIFLICSALCIVHSYIVASWRRRGRVAERLTFCGEVTWCPSCQVGFQTIYHRSVHNLSKHKTTRHLQQQDAGIRVQQCTAIQVSGHGGSGGIAHGQHHRHQALVLDHGQATHLRLQTILAVPQLAAGLYQLDRGLVLGHDPLPVTHR